MSTDARPSPDTCSHAIPSMQEEAAEKIDAGLGKALSD
jgi:hypothetical protein